MFLISPLTLFFFLVCKMVEQGLTVFFFPERGCEVYHENDYKIQGKIRVLHQI
jgi:hypothetical protein